jgi:hypothetical protein
MTFTKGYFIFVFLAVAVILGIACFPPAYGQTASQCVSTARAGGTANVLTVSNLPCTATTTLLILTLSATNTTITPTLQMTGGAAQSIRNADGSAMGIGQLVSGTIVLLANNGSQWRVLNGAPKP